MSAMHYGWTKDAQDLRDYAFAPKFAAPALPPVVDLSTQPYEPPILDQRPLQSCSAHALSALVQFVRAKEGLAPLVPSRLFIYYNERAMANQVATDTGATIRNGIKTIVKIGVCAEELWPYDAPKYAAAPPKACYDAAEPHRAMTYCRISGGVDELKSCLAEGYPFVFGMSVFAEFGSPETARTGVLGMPVAGAAPLGGHAVTAVGYDTAAQTFKVRNSIGTWWGMRGYFTVPQAFMESRNCTDDFWTIRKTG